MSKKIRIRNSTAIQKITNGFPLENKDVVRSMTSIVGKLLSSTGYYDIQKQCTNIKQLVLVLSYQLTIAH